jgi:hypothetical protein
MTETSPAVEIEEQSEYEAPPGPRTGLLLTLAVAWLAAILWIAHASISVSGAQLVLMTAAIALPTVVAASLLAGGAVGLATISLLDARGRAPARRLLQIAAGALAGLVAGGLGSASILLTWGLHASVVALAVAVGVAGGIGGALAAGLPRPVAAAGLLATLVVFVVGFGFGYFKEHLIGLFGAGRSGASQHTAAGYFAATQAVVSAIVGGLVAFGHLRRTMRQERADAAEATAGETDAVEDADPEAAPDPERAAGPGPAPARWAVYLIAGAVPGVMLLLAEAVTRLGGSQLLALAAAGSDLDSTALDIADSSRLNHGLVVLFLGAITATIAFGNTLPRRRAVDDNSSSVEIVSAD